MGNRHPLYAWMRVHGLTAKQFCIDLGISRPALHNWDNGYSMPTPATLSRILALTKGEVTPNHCHAYWQKKQEKGSGNG